MHSAAVLAVLQELTGGGFLPRAAASTPAPTSTSSSPSPLPLHVTAVAGHSVGEYAALLAAGAVSLTDAAALLRARGLAMQAAADEWKARTGEGVTMQALLLSAPPPGSFSAGSDPFLSVTLQLVRAAVADAAAAHRHSVVGVAGINSPSQVVLSGGRVAVDAAVAALRELSASGALLSNVPLDASTGKKEAPLVRRAVPLPVSAPFHCGIMDPAADEMARRLGVPPPALLRQLRDGGSAEAEAAEAAAAAAAAALTPPPPAVSFVSPAVPLVANATASLLSAPADIAGALVAGITQPVRWYECVHGALRHARSAAYGPHCEDTAGGNVSEEEEARQARLAQRSVLFLELGTGSTLAGLVRQCVPAPLPVAAAAATTSAAAAPAPPPQRTEATTAGGRCAATLRPVAAPLAPNPPPPSAAGSSRQRGGGAKAAVPPLAEAVAVGTADEVGALLRRLEAQLK